MSRMERPSTALLESAYNELFHSSLDKLIQSSLHGKLFHGRQEEKGVAGRSMAWKIFLSRQPPLTTALNPNPIPPLEALRYSREHYVSLLREKMRAPDGSYEEGLQIPGDTTPTPAAPRKPDDWNLNNPLSLDSSNPWHDYFSALESQNTIRQDVERTFPEIPYFRSIAVQNEMTHILFLHASERENVGYRQGMHELLACVYRAIDFDSVERSCSSQVNPPLQELCDRTYVAADAYTLFGTIMQRMESWYEWRAPISDPISLASPIPPVPHVSANGEVVPSLKQQVNVLANGQLDLRQYVAPIIPTCASLRDEKLRVVDPHLWEKLHEVGVEPQLYGMRWLRLLFTREFSLAESMIIWDGLFASVATDPISPSSSSFSQQGFELALWISVAMLIRIRNSLIPGDYHTQLTHLLRYPNPRSLGAVQTSNTPALLLSQAQLLLLSPTPGTGASLVMQNRNELGIHVEIPDPLAAPAHRRRASGIAATYPQMASQGRMGHERQRLQDMITSRIMDANETLGIQRGFLNTISELRKNLPDISQTLIRTPSWNGSSISLDDERLDESARSSSFAPSDGDERVSWNPRPRSEVERELSELRMMLKSLGDAVGWAVDVLLLDEDESKEVEEGEKTLRERKTEAVQCMAYVRDVLSLGGKGEIDEQRLISREDYQRKQRNKEEQKPSALESRQSPSSKPAPLPTRIASPETTSPTAGKPPSAPSATTPIVFLTKTPIPRLSPRLTSPGTPLASFSSRANHTPQRRPQSMTTKGSATAPRNGIQPWQSTPKFSGDSPYANDTLDHSPPSSTDGYGSISRVSPNTTEAPPPESPRADPLGVLR